MPDDILADFRDEIRTVNRRHLLVGEDGLLRPASFDDAFELMYHDCAPDVARWAYGHLTPEPPFTSNATALTSKPWETIPTTYVVCTDDHSLPPAAQRALATRAQKVVDFPTSHSPFLSRPDLVIDLLAALVDPDTRAGGTEL